ARARHRAPEPARLHPRPVRDEARSDQPHRAGARAEHPARRLARRPRARRGRSHTAHRRGAGLRGRRDRAHAGVSRPRTRWDSGMALIESRVEDGVAALTISHPPLNVLTRALLSELRETLAALAADPTLRVLGLFAAGRDFSAGADVREHLPPDYRDLIPEMALALAAVVDFPLPVVAAVRGRCLGGGLELVLTADLVVAAETATFGQPEIRLGVTAPFACALLPRRTPRGAAAELL